MDWFSKKIVGYSVSMRCRSHEWKAAVEMAVQRECPWGSREEDINLISDNGSQPTSTSFMKDMATLGIKQIFTSYDNPKGNADTERVIRTIKEEVIWANDFNSFEGAEDKICPWIGRDYNLLYPHSTLKFLSPVEFEAKYYDDLKKSASKIAQDETSQDDLSKTINNFAEDFKKETALLYIKNYEKMS